MFPGTVRDGGVYIPAQYDPARPAALMVFQDGIGYLSTNGSWRVPLVFDNLIAAKEMPVTIAIFLNPGTREGQSNRSFEYDSLGDRYASFLVDEFLPVALRGLNVSKDPQNRAVCGISSGAILHASCQVASEIGHKKRVLAILPDTGERYLSTELWS